MSSSENTTNRQTSPQSEPRSKLQMIPPTINTTILLSPASLTTPSVLALFNAHITSLQLINTKNNQLGHLLSLPSLQSPSISLYTARCPTSGALMGCAALKELSPTHGELKSMRTEPTHQRKGVAAALVRYLVDVARERGYERVSLETGVQEEFGAARTLYERCVFEECEAYEGFEEEGVQAEGSVFMTMYL